VIVIACSKIVLCSPVWRQPIFLFVSWILGEFFFEYFVVVNLIVIVVVFNLTSVVVNSIPVTAAVVVFTRGTPA
jgi:hypothetical protein